MSTFTEPELRAGVEAAEDWATYVTVHAYPPGPIQRAIAAGAKCIEHGHLMDEATASLMAEKGMWLSIQPFVGDDDSICLTGESRMDQLQVLAGTDRAYTLAKAHGIKTAFGSDLLFSGTLTARQGAMLTHLTRWYPNAEILRMATAANADLLRLPVRAILIRGNWGSSTKARSPICCSSTAIPSRTSSLWRIQPRIFSSS